MPTALRFEMLAKCGYAARGAVFLLVAGLALFSGVAGAQPESKPAIAALLEQPFGRLWVGLIGLGLLGFVAWRIAQSLGDSDGHGSGGKGLAIRAALFGSAATYLSLAIFALGHALLFSSDDGGGSGEQGMAQWIMSQPFGSYLAILVGLGFIVGGAITAAKGIRRTFEKYIQIPGDKRAATFVCMYGLIARGVVFAITGVFFAYAGFRVDPEQAGSMSDALQWLQQLPFGSVLYIVVAIGLAAFGGYNLIAARYRTVKKPSLEGMKRTMSLKTS